MKQSRPNVLFIVADDLNSWIGSLGRSPDVRTPAIDALAARGTLFTNAYCAAPYCNASRMSVFTACLPSTTGVYRDEPFWEVPHRRPTYVEALREAGYHTFGAGKVFHGVFDYQTAARTHSLQADWVEMQNRPQLWDQFVTNTAEPLPPGRPLNRLFDFDKPDEVPRIYQHFDWGPLPDEDEERIPDEGVFRSISAFLESAPQQPFFCAAGLYKPHLPWHVPKRFFDLYDPDQISLPLIKRDDLDDVPDIAKRWALSPRDHELVEGRGQWRPAVQGYLAAISYCDWMIGRIVEALEGSGLARNTAIVLWGDNGFHLGEKLHWRKFTLWDEATRVPLVIVPPEGWKSQARVHEPVSLMDLFPTIWEMCGLETRPLVDGESLLGVMRGEGQRKSPAISTWLAGNHSVRLGHWRYTRYSGGGEELYEHQADPYEWRNLASDSRFAPIKVKLRALLPTDSAG